MIHATFIMEQHIGHRTFSENLHRFIAPLTDLQTHWVPVTYEDPDTVWTRLRGLPEAIRGPLNGRSQIMRGLRHHAADVTVFNTQVPAVLAGPLIPKRPYFLCTDITPRQYDTMASHYGHSADTPGPLRAAKHAVNRRLFQNATRLLPWSSWTAASLINDYGVNPARVTVLPPGVDVDAWTPAPPRAAGPLHILFVGGHFARKGGDTLLAAFRDLPPQTAVLHIVTRSDVPAAANVRVYRDMQPNAPELLALYARADVFVLPTRAEAFGIAAIEAAASGLPVIATRVGGLVDVVVDGQTGYLLPPDDVAALRDRLCRLVAEPDRRRQMGRAARARVEARFDARKNAEMLATLIRETAVGGHP